MKKNKKLLPEEDMDKKNYPDYIEQVYKFDITKSQSLMRIDKWLTENIKNATRTKVKKAIEGGHVTVNGKVAKASRKVHSKDKIVCTIMKAPPIELIPEDIPLDILFEDDFMMIVNKPPGMVTHPGFGNRYGTLVNAVLYHLGMRDTISIEVDEDEVPEADNANEGQIFAGEDIRPGIVHRLDKDTSGLLVIAKEPGIHAKLAEQFADRSIDRYYYALVWGEFDDDSGRIEGDIGRSARDRKLFDIVKYGGKHAVTDYEVVERFEYMSLLRLKLQTGRTHQIRVHLTHKFRPVFGDQSYGGDKMVYGKNNPKFKHAAEKCLKLVDRQMLHARTLGLTHPETGERINFESELPADMLEVIDIIRKVNTNRYGV